MKNTNTNLTRILLMMGKNTKTTSVKLLPMGLAFVLTLAFLLRLPGIFESFWLDEAAQALESVRPLSQQLQIVADFQPPLLHLLTHFASQISVSEWWLRLFGAFIPGLITIFFTYKITQKIANHKPALIASLLLATSSFHIFYSQELRPYSLSALWAVASWYILLVCQTESKASNWFKYFLFTTLGLFSSYLYPFLLIGQCFYLLIKRQMNLAFFTSLLASIITFSLWLPMFFKQLQAGQLLRTAMPGWSEVVSTPQIKAIILLASKLYFGVINLELNALFVVLGFSIALLIIYLTNSTWKNKTLNSSFLLLASWLIVPALTAWLISFFVPVVQPKRLIFILPAMYIFIALICQLINQKKYLLLIKQNFAQISLLILTFSVNIYSTFCLLTMPQYQRENWRDLQLEISQRFSPTDTVIVNAFTEPFSPWVWYDQKQFTTFSTGTFHYQTSPTTIQELKQLDKYDYVLVFDYLRDLTDPNDLLTKEIEAFGYKGVGVIDYPNIGFVRIYTKTGKTTS